MLVFILIRQYADTQICIFENIRRAMNGDVVVVLKYNCHVLYKCYKPPEEFGLVSSFWLWQMLLKRGNWRHLKVVGNSVGMIGIRRLRTVSMALSTFCFNRLCFFFTTVCTTTPCSSMSQVPLQSRGASAFRVELLGLSKSRL